MPAPRPANRLAGESSPYLLQHAHNPVDWFPWGEEAFAAARERDVPLFLSIGYATCYWCHVMERECFESPEIARLMNQGFVCVKVDREERPDVDDVYMTAIQLLTGRGGWPMSVFLTPPGARGGGDRGLEPYWGGTYFPPTPRPGMPSFPQVLTAMSNAYANQKDDVLEQAASLTGTIRGYLNAERAPVRLDASAARRAFEALASGFDSTNGGFHGAPKFPQAVFLEFLLDARERWGGEDRERADRMLRLTLDRMATGGIHDQIGGGFHRYAVDATWTVPHFEKMLYDQGQLASVYARAAGAFDDPYYARVARRIGTYVIKEMRHEAGGFFSAQDAEVEAREGLNYLWTREEIERVLAGPDAELALRAYSVDAGPNFQDPHHESEPPRNVLRLAAHPDRLATQLGMSAGELWDRLDAINAALMDERSKRQQPATDDKVIASWNGLMIAGLAESASALDEPALARAAARAADFVLREMRAEGGQLVRTWRDGRLGAGALLEDYAFVIRGLLALHRATGEARWREESESLADVADRLFGSPEGGAFDTTADRTDLIVRAASSSDGAVPCASSVMLQNLRELGRHESLGRALAAMSSAVADNPLSAINSTRLLLHLDQGFLEAHGMGEGAAERRESLEESPVEIFASANEVEVGADGAEVSLEFRIAEGHHVNARHPGAEGLVGLDVDLEGAMGFELVADYPPGQAYEGPAAPAGVTLYVHEGSVRVDCRIELTGEPITGSPRLVATYQACDDRACLAPMQSTLGVRIRASEAALKATGD